MDSHKKLLSVIMPIHGANPDYTKKSINSILSQTYDKLELIVVMDRSGTPLDAAIVAILDTYKDDHRLRKVVHDKRKGLVTSLNEGISISKGQYIARADSDDISFPNRLEYQLDFLTANQNHLVGSWAYVIDEQGKIKGKLILPVSPEAIRRLMMMHNMILHGSVLIKKEVLKNIGLYNPAFYGSEDYELWLRMLSKGYSLGNCPEYLICLRENPDSITRGKAWFENRFMYIKSKAFACLRYHYLRPTDISYFFLSILSLLVHPYLSIPVKKFLGICRNEKAYTLDVPASHVRECELE